MTKLSTRIFRTALSTCAIACLIAAGFVTTGCQSNEGYSDGVGIPSPFSSTGRPVYSKNAKSQQGLGAKDKDYVHAWP